MAKKNIEIEEEESEGGLFLQLFSVIAVIIFFGLCWYAYTEYKDNLSPKGIVFVKADKSAFKIVPENPGGMVIENTDKEVFNALIGEKEDIEDNLNVIKSEKPIKKEALVEKQFRRADKKIDEETGEEIAVGEDVSFEKLANEASKDEAKQVEAAKEKAKNIKEGEQLKEDVFSLVDEQEVAEEVEDSAEKMDEKATTEDPNKIKVAGLPEVKMIEKTQGTEAEEQAEAEEELLKAEEKKAEAKIEAKKEVAKVEEAKQDAEEMVETVEKKIDEETGVEKTKIIFKEAPKSITSANKGAPVSFTKAVPATEPTGAFYVQVTSSTSLQDAENTWRKVSTNNSDAVGGKGKRITDPIINGVKYYRLSYGPFNTRSDAGVACAKMKARGQDCLVTAN